MGTLLRLLIARFLPGRIGWVIAAWVVARLLARRQAESTARPAPRRVQPVTVPVEPRRAR
jgi:hypothetical protein